MNFTINTVENYLKMNKNARWNGWDILIFTPSARAWSNVRGVFRDGQWGFEKRISPNKQGKWIVPDNARP